MKYLKIALFFVFVAAGILFYQFFVKTAQQPKKNPITETAINVELLEVKHSNFTPAIRGYGYVKPLKSWKLVPRIEGRVEYIAPDLLAGKIVKKDSLLVRLDKKELELDKLALLNNIKSVELELQQLDVQQANLEKDLALQKEYLELVRKDLTRIGDLLQRGSVSEQHYDTAYLNYINAQAKIRSIENSMALIPIQRSLAESKKQQHSIQLEDLALRISYCEITLPFDAIVISKSVEEAENVRIGATLAEFDAISEAEVHAQFPIDQLSRIIEDAEGDTSKVIAYVDVELFGQKYTRSAKFSRTYPVANRATRTVNVILLVSDPFSISESSGSPSLIRELFCHVRLESQPQSGKLIIPRLSVYDGVVYLSLNDRLKQQIVEVERFQEDVAIIRSGLNVGDKVIISRVVSAIEGLLLNDVNAPKKDKKSEKADADKAKQAQQ